MAQMLTAKQVAEVKGCSPRYIKKIIQDGKLKAVETVNSKNRKTYPGCHIPGFPSGARSALPLNLGYM